MMLDEALRVALRDVLREELPLALAAVLAEQAPRGLLARRQLGEALGMTSRTVARLEREGLPGVGAGRLRRFDLAAVRAWLDGRSRPAAVIDLRQRADELLARGRRGGGGR